MGFLGKIFGKIFDPPVKHPVVPPLILANFSTQEQVVLKDISSKLQAGQTFSIDFQTRDGAKIAVDFTGKRLNIDIFCSDGGQRLGYKAVDHYMGVRQWGGGIISYASDGSLISNGCGVYPRKFNSALDVFNYTIQNLDRMRNLQDAAPKAFPAVDFVKLHQPLLDDQIQIVKSLVDSAHVANPKEVAQQGELTKLKGNDGAEWVLKRLAGGRLLESSAQKIFLKTTNINHFRWIEKLDELERKEVQPHGTPVEFLGRQTYTVKAQPCFEADGVTEVRLEPDKPLISLKKSTSTPRLAA